MILRRDRGPALLLGTVPAPWPPPPVAWQVGRRFGLSDYQSGRTPRASEQALDRPPDLHSMATLLVPAFAAVIVCTLLAGWSNDPDLEVPGARPGYGNNAGHADDGLPSRDSSVGARRPGQIRQRHRYRPHPAQQPRLAVQVVSSARSRVDVSGAASNC